MLEAVNLCTPLTHITHGKQHETPVLLLQVYPKLLDTFLLAIYGSLIPVAYTQTAWLLQWLTVFHHGAVALFMWVSAAAPQCI